MKPFASIAITALLLLAGIAPAHAQLPTTFVSFSFENNGIISTFHYSIPQSYDTTKTYPLIYGWHGAGMPGSSMRDLLAFITYQRVDAIILCPDANNIQTNVQFTTLMNMTLTHAFQNFKIDQKRCVITGYSWGGSVAYQMGLVNADLFAGIIGLMPAIQPADINQQMWGNISKIRMATIIGDKDMNFAVVDPLMKDIPQKGGALHYIVKPNVVHTDNAYLNSQEFYDDYWECYQYIFTPAGMESPATAQTLKLSTYPSPVTDGLNVEILGAGLDPASIIVTSISGKEVYRTTVTPQGRDIRMRIPADQWPEGMYVVRAQSGAFSVIQKVVKIR